MIVLIDNYDSFSYNLYQLVGSIEQDLEVVRNDALSVAELAAMAPEAVLLSPGPGRPSDAGICVECVRELSGQIPILGVCLGHQAICEAFGATVTYARELMHGKRDEVYALEPDTGLFAGIESPFFAARYHSLAVDQDTLPASLRVTSRASDGEVMSVEHVEHPTYGLQFHPESVMTPDGRTMVENFLRAARSACRP